MIKQSGTSGHAREEDAANDTGTLHVSKKCGIERWTLVPGPQRARRGGAPGEASQGGDNVNKARHIRLLFPFPCNSKAR